METPSSAAGLPRSLRRPAHAISKASARLKRIIRLCGHPARFINTIQARVSKHAEVISNTPRHVVFWVTDRCNMGCHWCLMNVDESKDIQHEKLTDMTLDTFTRILGTFPALEAVSFTGQGEPLMNKDFFPMLELARRKRLTCFLTTNGLLLNEQNVMALIRLGLFRVNISLKGRDVEEYTKVTGCGETAFKHNLDCIRRCTSLKKEQKSDMTIRISYVVDRKHLGYMDDVISLAEDLGVDAVLFDNLVPFQDLKHGEGCLFEDDLEVKTHMERLVTRKSSVDVELPVLLRRDRFTHYCAGYHEFLNVDAMGNVSGCMRDLAPDQGYGNVFRDRHAMNTEHFKETRKMFMNKQLPDRCKVCVEMSR